VDSLSLASFLKPERIDILINNRTLLFGEVIEWNSREFPEFRYREIIELFAKFAKWDADLTTIPVDLLYERLACFRRYLRNQNISVSWFKKYSDHIPELFDKAETKGWAPDQNLSPEWQRLLEKARERKLLDLVRFFARQTPEPLKVTHDQVVKWMEDSLIEGDRTYFSARDDAWAFENFLIDEINSDINPILKLRRRKFSIPLEEFPEPIKREVHEFLRFRAASPEDWRIDDYEGEIEDEDDWSEQPGLYDAVKVSQRRQLRPNTADRLKREISSLYGYAVNEADPPKRVSNLRDLFKRAVFQDYKLCLKKRHLSTRSICNTFGALVASARQYPLLASRKWYDNFVLSLEKETVEEEKSRRIDRACVPLEILEQIPFKIEEDLSKIRGRRRSKLTAGFFAEKRIEFQIAWLEMQKFLMLWMLELPWPTRNICECRLDLGIPGKVPNLFQGTAENIDEEYLTESAKESLRSNSKIWQFRFSAEETSGCGPVHWVLPDSLIDPLELYLRTCRPNLAKDNAADTLFLNRHSTSLRSATLNALFVEITLRHATTRITPQAFRDIWAFDYLKGHNNDFDSLAPMLWHLNSKKTKELYGP
jgi:hypothetical protein